MGKCYETTSAKSRMNVGVPFPNISRSWNWARM